jgi:hypothetical protein
MKEGRNTHIVGLPPSAQHVGFAGVSSVLPRAVLPVALPVAENGAGPLGEALGIREVARLLGCSAWTVRQRYMPGGLPHFRLSPTGKLTFYREQVVRWVQGEQQRRSSR